MLRRRSVSDFKKHTLNTCARHCPRHVGYNNEKIDVV